MPHLVVSNGRMPVACLPYFLGTVLMTLWRSFSLPTHLHLILTCKLWGRVENLAQIFIFQPLRLENSPLSNSIYQHRSSPSSFQFCVQTAYEKQRNIDMSCLPRNKIIKSLFGGGQKPKNCPRQPDIAVPLEIVSGPRFCLNHAGTWTLSGDLAAHLISLSSGNPDQCQNRRKHDYQYEDKISSSRWVLSPGE